MPNPALKLSSPLLQYLIGVSLNLLYVIILTANNTSYKNIQLPEGIYADNLWKGGDVFTYVSPARNFVDHHIFGSGTTPGYHRTIGYPLFLSVLMLSFANNWLMAAFFVQALLFASIYPALCRISGILLNSSPRVAAFSFLFFTLSGAYLVMVPIIMTDLFFTVLFTLGLYFGLEAIIRKSWIFLLLQIVFIGYAAQVRPVLGLYPVVNLLVLIYVAYKNHNVLDMKIYKLITVSSIVLLIFGNLPAFRNYINHGFFKPTDVLSNALFHNLAYRVSSNEGKLDEYNAVKNSLKEIADIKEAIETKEKSAAKIFQQYPLMTLVQMGRNAIGIMARGHWTIAANFWGYNFKDIFRDEFMPRRKSEVVFLVEVFFNFVYLTVYMLLCGYLIRLCRKREFTALFTIVLLLSYFLIPTFMVDSAGSRYRLPVEGIIVSIGFIELECHLELIKNAVRNFGNGVATFLTQMKTH